MYYWVPREEAWQGSQRDAYVHKPTGQIVAALTYYQHGFGEDVVAMIYADKPGDCDANTPDRYTFVDVESAKKFVERKFKEDE